MMKFSNPRKMGALSALLLTALYSPAIAQEQEQEHQEQEQSQDKPGEVTESAVGKVGQRQSREEMPTHIEPMARINNRITNRVQNRIRNRLDRYYDPQADAASPFEVAAEQARKAGATRASR